MSKVPLPYQLFFYFLCFNSEAALRYNAVTLYTNADRKSVV